MSQPRSQAGATFANLLRRLVCENLLPLNEPTPLMTLTDHAQLPATCTRLSITGIHNTPVRSNSYEIVRTLSTVPMVVSWWPACFFAFRQSKFRPLSSD